MSISENANQASTSPLATTWRLVVCGVVLCGCRQGTASAEQPPSVSSEPESKTLEARPGLSVPSTTAEEKDDDAELRRGYGLVDMRFNGCVKRENDYTVVGDSCPGGFLIYGPYIPVPANSEIEVAFEIQPSKTVSIYADIVSQMGVQTLAGLTRQRIEAGKRQKVGYRVHVFNADVNVESRVGMDADPGTKFQIANLTMTVR